MIVLFTDFGPAGPYLGQMKAVLQQQAPNSPVIDLISNAPAAQPRLSSYLLSAFRRGFPEGTIFLSVIDPGVGGARRPVVLQADGQYFVGPDNDLFNTVAAQSQVTEWWEIIWRPAKCSVSFHGRDLFAPVAANLANDTAVSMLKPISMDGIIEWPADTAEIIYFDFYGNAMTGLRYHENLSKKSLRVKGDEVRNAEMFSAVPEGHAFWYKNSSGLVEIAVNRGSAKNRLDLELGTKIEYI